MPIKSLPSNPSLAHLKYQAWDLLNALNQGKTEALASAREFHPKFARTSDHEIRAAKVSLADAQFIIARGYGFDSWPKLKHHVEGLTHAASPTIEVDFKPPSGPVELKQKWPAGARIVREMDVKQKKEIHTPGKHGPDIYDVSMRTHYAFTVVREHPSGAREVDLEHLGFRVEEDSGAHLWRYDSASEYAGGRLAELFKIVMGSKIRYFLNASSQVERRMERVDELMNRLRGHAGVKVKPGMTWDNQALDKVIHQITSSMRQHRYAVPSPYLPGLRAAPASLSEPPKSPLVADISLLTDMSNAEYFNHKLGPLFLPAKLVQPGNTWNVSRECLMHRGDLVIAVTVTFQCWEKRGQHICARLEFRGTETSLPRLQSEAANKFFFATVGTFSGLTWFDPESGQVIETVGNHDFTVTLNKPAAPDANPTAGPIRIGADHYHQVVTEKLVSVN